MSKDRHVRRQRVGAGADTVIVMRNTDVDVDIIQTFTTCNVVYVYSHAFMYPGANATINPSVLPAHVSARTYVRAHAQWGARIDACAINNDDITVIIIITIIIITIIITF